MKQYTIEYQEDGNFSPVKSFQIIAKTTADAYCEFIRKHNVWAAWVARYTTQKGTVHEFNNFAGKAY